MSTGQENLIFN